MRAAGDGPAGMADTDGTTVRTEGALSGLAEGDTVTIEGARW